MRPLDILSVKRKRSANLKPARKVSQPKMKNVQKLVVARPGTASNNKLVKPTKAANATFVKPTSDFPPNATFVKPTSDFPANATFVKPTSDLPANATFAKPTSDLPANATFAKPTSAQPPNVTYAKPKPPPSSTFIKPKPPPAQTFVKDDNSWFYKTLNEDEDSWWANATHDTYSSHGSYEYSRIGEDKFKPQIQSTPTKQYAYLNSAALRALAELEQGERTMITERMGAYHRERRDLVARLNQTL